MNMTKEIAYVSGEFGQRYIVFNRAGAKKAKSKARRINSKRAAAGLPTKDMDYWITDAAKKLTVNGISMLVID